jgi:hypothetical protein
MNEMVVEPVEPTNESTAQHAQGNSIQAKGGKDD